MRTSWFWFLLGSTPIQASSYQEYCSNAAATVRIARGHMVNEVSVTERIPRDWGAFVDQKLTLSDAYVGVVESTQLEEDKKTVCKGAWGLYSWRDVFYRRIRVMRPDGMLFAGNVLGVSKDKSYVEALVICEEHGNAEVMCEESSAP